MNNKNVKFDVNKSTSLHIQLVCLNKIDCKFYFLPIFPISFTMLEIEDPKFIQRCACVYELQKSTGSIFFSNSYIFLKPLELQNHYTSTIHKVFMIPF